jgi:hypothetical protein
VRSRTAARGGWTEPLAGTDEREYSRRMSLYENDEGMVMLQTLARERGVTVNALLRLLIREEATRRGVKSARQMPDAATTGEP